MRLQVCFNVSVAGMIVLAVGAVACRRDADAVKTNASTDTAVVSPSGVGATSSHVGLRYDSLPAGFTYKGGSLIPPSPNGPAGEYGFSHVVTPRGEMIWLDTIGAASGRASPSRIVRAELSIPPLAADERVFMASCDAGGKLDPLVVAIVVNEPNVSRFSKVRQAWRADVRARRFEVIPVNGVVCEDPGS
jgi:hypothetical protein